MERLRLWRYKKLANENVKDEKVIDDEDYNSCFQLRTNLKVRIIFTYIFYMLILYFSLIFNPLIYIILQVDNATVCI